MELDLKQKISLAGLSIVSVFIVVLVGGSFVNSILEPEGYRYNTKKNKVFYDELAVDESVLGSRSSELDSKILDTDGDGLSDWDEVNIYSTSPYLEDTDSDGVIDGEEILVDSDPGCPAGEDCYGVPLYSASADVKQNPLEFGLGGGVSGVEGADLEAIMKLVQGGGLEPPKAELSEEEMRKIAGEIDSAEEIRELLLNTGFPVEMLESISDEQLIEVYSGVVSE